MALMKVLYLLLLAGAVAMAQSPAAPKKTPAKTSGTAARPNPLLNPAGLRAIAPAVYNVRIATTHGDFVVEVHRDWAPRGADRFYNLVRHGFYTNAAFFRVVPGALVQFGMSPDPAVSKAWDNATIRDDPPKESNQRGTLSFATRGADTRTTQIFINLQNNTPYDKDYIPFGKIIEGLEVVNGFYSGYGQMPDQDKIGAEGKVYLDRVYPKLDLIKSATVAPAIAAAPATGAPPATPKKQ